MDEIRTSTRKLYPSRTTADDGYRHEPLALGVVGREFSPLQIRKNFPPDILGIGEGFETERVCLPVVVSEKSRFRTRREDKIVEGVSAPRFSRHGLFVRRNGRHLVHKHGDIFGIRQDLADRPSDVRSCQRGCGNLIEQRLKKMVVRPIEKGHLETLVIGELARALKSRESAPDDEHLSRCGMLAGHAWSLASFSLNGKPCL